MPLYSYYHDTCGYQFEDHYPVYQRDIPISLVCPKCKKYGVQRKVGCAGFQLKGGGWAKSGYSKFLGDNKKFKDDTWNPYNIEENL